MDFTLWPATILEQTEQVECLRFLEHAVPIKMGVVNGPVIEIKTAADLEKANEARKDSEK
jgi:CMP-2-keto-3-deoxyoctulosonic acid synthetase